MTTNELEQKVIAAAEAWVNTAWTSKLSGFTERRSDFLAVLQELIKRVPPE
jgi:hypothetical protein